MSYAIIAGVIFAWAVCFGWAALEVRDARKKNPVTFTVIPDAPFTTKSSGNIKANFLHNGINVGGSDERYQSGSLRADWYLDKNPVGTYYEEP